MAIGRHPGNHELRHKMTRQYRIDDLVDFISFPLDQPESIAYKNALNDARAQLQHDGCAVIKNLLRPTAIKIISQEIVERKSTTHFSTSSMNPYFHSTKNPDYPDHHPVNTFIERSSGFIPGDSWDASLAIDILFRSELLTNFIRDALETEAVHCYADPLAGLTANILDPGQQFAWHFDTNEFAVTAMIDEADDGGLFQYVPMIRTPDDESFDRIQKVLDDDCSEVKTLELHAGDLQIFRGRHSLHRVTRVPKTSKPRHAAIFAYTAEPGVIGRVERTRQLFGRVLPAHEEAEKRRVRSDALID
ncbi:hypothetical protein EMGBS4_20520 [Acidimicrobiaceae bacterium]|nr:hypothetical protein EMGBS4_20520 [Acidimicrobiaceae bacterium]